ncbi:MAG TPA: hypothetical protein VHQ47_08250 [Phycisphaerae bacterium]|jgi:hypothetical protein|nr:hypothetical protein [Phycisphaerae bacterium]
MKKRWRWFWYAAGTLFLLAVVLLLADVALAAHWRRIPLNASTTRITAPLAPDGLPDYLKAINDQYSKGVTPDNNAAPAVITVVGLTGKPAWKKTVLRLLNIPDPGAGMLTPYATWAKKQTPSTDETAPQPPSPPTRDSKVPDPEAPLEEAEARPWKRADHPEVAAYLASQSAALDALEKAVQRDRFYQPTVAENGDTETHARPVMVEALFAPDWFQTRQAARALVARAMLRAGENDPAGFTQDITTLIRLAQLIAQGPLLTDYLSGMPIQATAMEIIQQVAAAPGLDPAAIAPLQNLLAAAGPTPTPARQLDTGERYMMLDGFCTLNRIAASPSISSGGFYPPLPVNFPAGMIEANDFFDRMRDAFVLPIYSARQSILQAGDAQIQAIDHAGRWHKLTHLHEALLPTLAPSVARVNILYTEDVADEHLAKTTLALRLYRATHPTFPPALSDLPLPADAATDPFTNKPLLYHKSPTGYRLYSVGPDLHDNGGKPRGTKPPEFDIVVKSDN